MLSFSVAVFILVITPGPAVLSIAGVGAAFGYRATLWYLFGVILGANLVAVFVISGLAAMLLGFPGLRIVLMTVSLCYIAYLAARIALAGSKPGYTIAGAKPPGVLAGIVLQIINPKAYVVMLALFSGFPFMPDSLMAETLVKFIIANLIWIPAHMAWLYLGVSINRLDLSSKGARVVNVTMALALLTVVLVTAFSTV